MQVTSMLSAGYLEPVQNISRIQNVNRTDETDISKQRKEQEILSEEQSLKAKLGNNAQVHTVYHYSMGSDGRRYITGASVTMKGTEEDLNRVSGGVTTQDLQNKNSEEIKKAEEKKERNKILESSAKKRETENSEEKDAQIRELENTEREVIAHEMAHKAAAGEFGGGISYTYTKGPDGKSYITGGEVPIHFQQGSTPEETLQNMQQIQRAANAPADPSDQDRNVAAKAAAMASRARQEIAQGDDSENQNEGLTATVIKGTPIIEEIEPKEQDPNKNGVLSLLATVKEHQILGQIIPAA